MSEVVTTVAVLLPTVLLWNSCQHRDRFEREQDFWLDTYVTGYNAGTGFVLFNGVEDLGQGTITGNIPTANSYGQVTTLVVNFKGLTNDGDGDTYTGRMTLISVITIQVAEGEKGVPARDGASSARADP